MKPIDDLKVEIEMNFKQIRDLCDLMLENDNYTIPNIMTIRDISELGVQKSQNL